mmetsp:Transcript_256/g.479  ORF Transcript_256/g.479 Transcript_256/m.479 type:complete len:89 (+) Transcript_256:1314-1580(+)
MRGGSRSERSEKELFLSLGPAEPHAKPVSLKFLLRFVVDEVFRSCRRPVCVDRSFVSSLAKIRQTSANDLRQKRAVKETLPRLGKREG